MRVGHPRRFEIGIGRGGRGKEGDWNGVANSLGGSIEGHRIFL